jgi:hypothetical protein
MLAVPSSDGGWDLYRRGSKVRSAPDLKELTSSGVGITVAVPAQYASTFVVSLPTTDSAVFSDMAFAQIERRGLARESEGDVIFDHHTVGHEGNTTDLSIDVLSAEFPETWSLPKADGYVASARVLEMPDDKLMLWREHKRLVLAANHGGRVTHVQVVSAGTKLGEAVAQEVNLTALSLQGEGAIGENPDLVVVGEFSREHCEAFEKASVLPVEFAPERRVRASVAATDPGLTPAAVLRARHRRSRGKQRGVVLALVALFYAGIVFFLWNFSKGRAQEIADLQAEVAAIRPAAEKVQRDRERWEALEPSVDLRFYPLVQLNQITRVMPPSGLVIREFQTRGRNVRIRGRARDAQLAFRFEEGLEANEALGDYQWNMPNPKVERDNSATFEVQGKWAAGAPPQ